MRYSKVQNKITSGKSEQIIGETTYFHFDGHDKNTIETWLSNHYSILHILNCFLKSWWNREAIREKAISQIESRKRYEESTQQLIAGYKALLKEKEARAETPTKPKEN